MPRWNGQRPNASLAGHEPRVCLECLRLAPAVAEATYVNGLCEMGPVWVCPVCFERLETEVIGVELTGRVLGDRAAFVQNGTERV